MMYAVDSKTKTLEFTQAGSVEEVMGVIRLYPGYSYRFSAEESSVFERIQSN